MSHPEQTYQPVHAAAAAFIGAAVEFYDYHIYVTAAAFVLGEVFFPSSNDFLSTMASFGTFFVCFVARPLSGAVVGNLGDKLDRKGMLLMTMFLMGPVTTDIGLLAGAGIGVWAPIPLVLLRLLQGIAVGGEWGGAVLTASAHTPPERKTSFASFLQMCSLAGLILSLISFRLVSSLDHESLVTCGWQLSILASVAFLPIGMAIRLGIQESSEFEQLLKPREVLKSRVAEVPRTSWYSIVPSAMAATIGTAGNTFPISNVTAYLGTSKSFILDCLFAVRIIRLISRPLSALLARRIDEPRFLTLAALLSMFTPCPMFLLVATQSPVAIMGRHFARRHGPFSELCSHCRFHGSRLFCAGALLPNFDSLSTVHDGSGRPDTANWQSARSKGKERFIAVDVPSLLCLSTAALLGSVGLGQYRSGQRTRKSAAILLS